MEETNFHSEIVFSKMVSEKRIQAAYQLFGAKTVNRIIGIALFLLGGNREKISEFLKIPVGTFFSFLSRFHREGVRAFGDQREKQIKPIALKTPPLKLEIVFGERKIEIEVLSDKNQLTVAPSNSLQFKTLMLSFMSSGFLSVKGVSEQLGISERHVRDLGKNLQDGDIETLLDKRRGQQKDYLFSEDIKAEIVQQFVVNLVSKKSTFSSKITQQVNMACRSSLSERAMRQHLSKLGLHRIKESLPKLLEAEKKSSKS